MDLPKDQYTNQGSASLLTYKPKDQMDYGTVLCLAENLVGRQVVPCVYHVIPAGKYYYNIHKFTKLSFLFSFYYGGMVFEYITI